MTVLINDCARQVPLSLVGTLHKVLLTVAYDADGIEAYYLHQGILKAETLEAAGDDEVLQVIVDEGYLMALGGGVKVFENLRERLRLIAA